MQAIDALVLKKIDRVGNKTLTAILKFMSIEGLSGLEELAEFGVTNFLPRTPPTLKDFLNERNFDSARDKCRQEVASWKAQGIEVMVLADENYPDGLRGLDNPPPLLFCKGNLDLLKDKAIAVVGTRKNTAKGEAIAKRTVARFSEYGFAIVSGLALGIDTVAHRAAIESDAPTIAVLVDLITISPSSNRKLAEEILDKGGLWVAENPPGTKVIPAFFASRDRIQAGLSAAVFAIETSVDGGTMHAVNASISMNRPVFVPDVIAAKYPDLELHVLSGIQQLVKDGEATAYTSGSYDSIRDQLENGSSILGSNGQGSLGL